VYRTAAKESIAAITTTDSDTGSKRLKVTAIVHDFPPRLPISCPSKHISFNLPIILDAKSSLACPSSLLLLCHHKKMQLSFKTLSTCTTFFAGTGVLMVIIYCSWRKLSSIESINFWKKEDGNIDSIGGFEEASESFLCVSMGSDEQETPLSGDSLALSVFTRLPYPISNSTTVLISETTYYK
ncbi:hypothetical protein CFP56_022819, partial [Quercus suber]